MWCIETCVNHEVTTLALGQKDIYKFNNRTPYAMPTIRLLSLSISQMSANIQRQALKKIVLLFSFIYNDVEENRPNLQKIQMAPSRFTFKANEELLH